jgi:hypothetical protein
VRRRGAFHFHFHVALCAVLRCAHTHMLLWFLLHAESGIERRRRRRARCRALISTLLLLYCSCSCASIRLCDGGVRVPRARDRDSRSSPIAPVSDRLWHVLPRECPMTPLKPLGRNTKPQKNPPRLMGVTVSWWIS